MWYRCKICDSQASKNKSGAWRIIIACIKEDQEWGTVSWFLSFAQLFFVTISLVILTNNNQSMILSVADGYSPFHIIFNQAFNCQLYMRELIVISVKTKSGNFQEHACLWDVQSVFLYVLFCLFFFASFKQAEVSVRWVLWTKEKSFLLYRVF